MPEEKTSETYDVAIVGAGISGLVCGSYLAQAGLRVLIAEQHHKPGGYCTSFSRRGFQFDAAADCFGGYREQGTTNKILTTLGVQNKIRIIRSDPSDVILTPDHQLPFWNDMERTIEAFQSAFPGEGKSIRNFFQFSLNPVPSFFSITRSMTFQDLLDHYFASTMLKASLSFPLLAITGLPSSLISAFIGIKLFSEFLLDGGYYPEGGMQKLADVLAEQFHEFGGTLLLSSPVRKIRVKGSAVTGILLSSGRFIASPYVVSNADARLTFLQLLGRRKLDPAFARLLDHMEPTTSNFILYAGMDRNISVSHPGSSFFFTSHYDLDRAYRGSRSANLQLYGGFAMRMAADRSTFKAIFPAPFKNRLYWQKNKQALATQLMSRIEQNVLPGLSQHVLFQETATPHTLHRYTLNFRGASYGWAGLATQMALPDLRKPSFIKGLYLTGHWTTLGTGISGVAYVGHDTAKRILGNRFN